MRRPIIAGNWKMYKTPIEAKEYIATLKSLVQGAKSRVLLSVPYVDIALSVDTAKGSNIEIGAQNLHYEDVGAFTGEISSLMLKSVGTQFVLIGHSERREHFHESDSILALKIAKALDRGIEPILCIGEHESDRDAGRQEDVIAKQLYGALDSFDAKLLSSLVVAYEPVWAIGTGKTATPQMAQSTHRMIRDMLVKKWGEDLAERTPILYGGSVKPDNISALMQQPDIDGALVGGASLDPNVFSQIVNFS